MSKREVIGGICRRVIESARRLWCRHRRLRARLRSDFPGVFFLFPLAAGQVSFYYTTSWGVLILMSCAAICWRLGGELKTFSMGTLLIVLSGMLSMWAAMPRRDAPIPSSHHSYVVRVDAAPRRRKQGEVEVSLRIIGEVGPAQQDREEFAAEQGSNAGERVLCKAIDLPWKNASAFEEGGVYIIRGVFTQIEPTSNPFSYFATLLRHGYSATCKAAFVDPRTIDPPFFASVRNAIRSRTESILGNNERSGLFLSLSLGLRDVVSDATEEAFKRVGLADLLVVSGYQVTLVYLILFFALKRVLSLFRRFSLRGYGGISAGCIAVLVSFAFVVVTGIEGSSMRAGVAAVFLVMSRFLERGGGMLNSIFVSLTVLSIIWPGVYFEPGVELTYAALFGIYLGADSRAHWFATYCRVSVYASLCTSIVVLLWFNKFSIAGFLLHPLLGPPAALVSCEGGFAALALLFSGIDPDGIALSICAKILILFRDSVVWLADFPFVSVGLEGWGKASAVVVLLTIVAGQVKRRAKDYVLRQNLYFQCEHDDLLGIPLRGRHGF